MISTCCTWVVSLVVRVISEAVLKRSNWCTEKCSTRAKMRPRTIRPNPIAILEAKKLPATAQPVPTIAISSIQPPIDRIARVIAVGRCRGRRCRPSAVAGRDWPAIAPVRARARCRRALDRASHAGTASASSLVHPGGAVVSDAQRSHTSPPPAAGPILADRFGPTISLDVSGLTSTAALEPEDARSVGGPRAGDCPSAGARHCRQRARARRPARSG